MLVVTVIVNEFDNDAYETEDIGPGTILLALVALTLAIAAYLLG